jgi:hypothetical protein
MSQKNRADYLEDCLARVNPERREFLKSVLVGSAAAATLPLIASSALAGELDEDTVNAQGKKGKGKGKKKKSS